MKILHTSDLHLGKKLNGYDLLEEQKLKLDQIVTYIKDEHIDVLILAGDIYDTALSTDEAIRMFHDFLAKLIKMSWLEIFVIAGNHDSRTRLGNKEVFRALNPHVHFFTTISDIESIQVGDVLFHAVPFLKLEDINEYYHEKYTSLNDGFTRIIKDLSLDKTKKNIGIFHQAVNPSVGEYQASDSEVKQIGGEDIIPASLFKDFTYVALGHIHMPQKIADNVFYSGSIYKYHHNESSQTRIFKVIDTNTNQIKDVSFELIHDVEVLTGYYEELKQKSSTNYTYLKLLDDSQILNAADGLKLQYPNFIGLEYEFKKKQAEETLDIKMDGKPMDELFDEFYQKMNGKDLTEYQKEILKKLFKGEEI